MYLANDKFTAHGDEANRMLDGHYETAVRDSIAGNDPDSVLALADRVAGQRNEQLAAYVSDVLCHCACKELQRASREPIRLRRAAELLEKAAEIH